MRGIALIIPVLLSGCAEKMHDGKYTHEQFWNDEVHKGHDMGDGQRHGAGHYFECLANDSLFDHCTANHGVQR